MARAQRIKEEVRRRYAARAKTVQEDSACCGPKQPSSISANLYTTADLENIPEEAVLASLGCGNPVGIAELRQGETVLDLGSGGGIDVILSARRVGPTGKAYGLDMTDEMLDLARHNALKAGVSNAEFLKGEIESIPLPDSSVDVIISNCVINLSPDKDGVLREAYRVLRPGGRLAIADIVTRRRMPSALRRRLELWAGCVAGALSDADYRAKLAIAGFHDIQIDVLREYTADDAQSGGLGPLLQRYGKKAGEGLGVISAVIRARKPGSAERPTVEQPPTSAADEELQVIASPGQGCVPGTCC